MKNNDTIDKTIKIDEIELHISLRKYNQAIPLILDILTLLINKRAAVDINEEFNPSFITANTRRLFTRIAAAISTILTSSETIIKLDDFFKFLHYKEIFSEIFTISGFNNTEHIISVLKSQYLIYPNKLACENITRKLFIAYTLNNDTTIDFSVFSKELPLETALTYLSLLTCDGLISKEATNIKSQLLAQNGYLQPLKNVNVLNKISVITQLVKVYMTCSYSEYEKKHSIKHEINEVLQSYTNSKNTIKNKIKTANTANYKPVMVIIFEAFTGVHAMYRCYSEVIKHLPNKFNVIAFLRESNVDEVISKFFDTILTYKDDEDNINVIINKIITMKPDVIYYPSLGMHHLAPILANLRLAPIQLITLGHPASSFAKEIDYVIFEEDNLRETSQNLFSERIVALPIKTYRLLPPAKHHTYKIDYNKSSATIKIAIAAKHYKLNYKFLSLLNVIKQKATKPIEFHFFPNCTGFELEYIKSELSQIFNEFIVYPSYLYEKYCELLGKCHIFASTFPFAGANSVYDALNLGLPVVTFESSHEVHSTSDTCIMRPLKLPEWLITKNENEYVDSVLRLIENDIEREELSKQCIKAIQENYACDINNDNTLKFTECISLLYQYHEAIKNTSGIIFYSDLLKLKSDAI